jgi:hypothetical protein
MAKTGRPSTYDPAVATKICEQLSEGISLREICRQEGMPPWQTVYSWMERDASLVEAIARAREIGYDALAEECLKIADDGTNDYVEGERGPQLNSEHIQRSKLRIERCREPAEGRGGGPGGQAVAGDPGQRPDDAAGRW